MDILDERIGLVRGIGADAGRIGLVRGMGADAERIGLVRRDGN